MDDQELTDLPFLPSAPTSGDLLYVVRDDASYQMDVNQIVLNVGDVNSIASGNLVNQIPTFSDNTGKQITNTLATMSTSGDAVLRNLSFGLDGSTSYPGLNLKHLTSTELNTSTQVIRCSLVGDSDDFDRPRYYHSNGSSISFDYMAYVSDIPTDFVISSSVSPMANQISFFSDNTGNSIQNSNATLNTEGDGFFRNISFGLDSSTSYPGLTLKSLTGTQLDVSTHLERASLVADALNFDRPRYYHSDGTNLVYDNLAYLSDISTGGGNLTSTTIPAVNEQFVVYDGTDGVTVKSIGFGPDDVDFRGGTIDNTTIGSHTPAPVSASNLISGIRGGATLFRPPSTLWATGQLFESFGNGTAKKYDSHTVDAGTVLYAGESVLSINTSFISTSAVTESVLITPEILCNGIVTTLNGVSFTGLKNAGGIYTVSTEMKCRAINPVAGASQLVITGFISISSEANFTGVPDFERENLFNNATTYTLGDPFTVRLSISGSISTIIDHGLADGIANLLSRN